MFTLPKWYDLHTHFRQDELLPATVKEHVAMACAGALAMPNLKPPLTQLEQVATYREEVLGASEGAFQDVIVPLYLNAETTPKMIEDVLRQNLTFMEKRDACLNVSPHMFSGLYPKSFKKGKNVQLKHDLFFYVNIFIT